MSESHTKAVKAVCVELPVTVARAAKADAAQRGITLQQWYAEAVVNRLDDIRAAKIPGAFA